MNFPFVRRATLLEAEERFVSLQQEFQNYRRRNETLAEASTHQGETNAIRALLPVYDNLIRALEQPTEDAAFREGIELTLTALKKSLETMGVAEIPALNQPFDPMLHEAMEHLTDPDAEENLVTKVVLTGFRRGDTVIRHALVVVTN